MRYKGVVIGPMVFGVGVIAGVAIASVFLKQDAPPGAPSPSGTQIGLTDAPAVLGRQSASTAPSPQDAATGFRMQFTQGDIANYRIDAAVRGKGFEAGDLGGVETRFLSDFSVFTKEVATDKSADLRISFDNAQLTGSFMDVPFEMGYTPERAYMFYGNTSVDTANAPSQTGNGQFDFFRNPISVRVAPNGAVQSVDGPEGMASLLTTVPTLSFVEYPEDAIQSGKSWESRFVLPIPGFGGSVNARVTNTFWGYQQMGAHTCGVIQQVYATDTADSSALLNSEGDLGIAMPSFDLNGQGLVYFDVANGKLVHSTLNLQLVMRLSKALGGLGDLLTALTQDLADPSDSASEPPSNLLDLLLTIEGAISLVDPAAPPPRQ